MKIRATEFAMIPLWVIQHPVVQEQPSRLAVYAAVRCAVYEFGGHKHWNSERELADDLGSLCGLGGEAVRKHLRSLRGAGIISGRVGELFLPSDRPGDHNPDPGDSGPLPGDSGPPHLYKREEEEKHTSDKSDANADFEAFYGFYPRHEGRGQALRAYRAARKKASVDQIATGLVHANARWKRERTEKRHIPLPASWLNGERWLDELIVEKPAGPKLVKMNGGWVADNPAWRGR